MRIGGPIAAAGALAALLVLPAAALAHGGLVGQVDMPVPGWLAAVAAGVVVAVSFALIAFSRPLPRLDEETFRPLPSRALTSRPVEVVCGAVGVALLAVTVWAGFAGSQFAAANFAPTFVFVVFWVGLVFASALLGDVFRLFNPWRALGRIVGSLAGRVAGEDLPPALEYPRRLGRWPAVAGLVAFTAFELVSSAADDPRAVAIAALVYSAATFLGMALFGVEAWIARGEAFSVYFNLLSRLSAFTRRGRVIGVRRPLSGLATVEPLPGTVALLCVMLGTVSFDGAAEGRFFQSLVPGIQDFWAALGLGIRAVNELTFLTGFTGAILILYGVFRIAVAASRALAGGGPPTRELARLFAPSLIPIAFAYVAAHYVSWLVYQGQAMVFLVSDPLGHGWNLFGTATGRIDYTLVGATAFWYIQLALVVGGHVAGLISAHDRALTIFRDSRTAVRSQVPLLVTMVGLTLLALWLLSQQNEG
jgi:hypothetical protein